MTSDTKDNMRFEHVQRFLASGMKVSEWCKLNGIANSTLYSWMARCRKTELSDNLSVKQKSKATSKWIEISRKDLTDSSALVLAPNPPTTRLRSFPASLEDRATLQNIGVHINGAYIAIAPGTARADIEVVCQVVSAL